MRTILGNLNMSELILSHFILFNLMHLLPSRCDFHIRETIVGMKFKTFQTCIEILILDTHKTAPHYTLRIFVGSWILPIDATLLETYVKFICPRKSCFVHRNKSYLVVGWNLLHFWQSWYRNPKTDQAVMESILVHASLNTFTSTAVAPLRFFHIAIIRVRCSPKLYFDTLTSTCLKTSYRVL